MSDNQGGPTFVAQFNPAKEREARLSKRFYKNATSRASADGFAVMLDERELKTPGRNPVRVSTEGLASAVAAEWAAQEGYIDPSTMPRTRIVTTAIDRVALDNGPAVDEITRYAGSDLVCYRADEPTELVQCQAEAWDPLLEWISTTHKARLQPTSGIIHVTQAADDLARIGDFVSRLDPIRITALHTLVTISGSAVIGLAVLQNHLDADQGFAVSRIDEAYQAAQWGEDEEAAERTRLHKAEFEAASEVIRLLA